VRYWGVMHPNFFFAQANFELRSSVRFSVVTKHISVIARALDDALSNVLK
jgi:hypothetical protein